MMDKIFKEGEAKLQDLKNIPTEEDPSTYLLKTFKEAKKILDPIIFLRLKNPEAVEPLKAAYLLSRYRWIRVWQSIIDTVRADQVCLMPLPFDIDLDEHGKISEGAAKAVEEFKKWQVEAKTIFEVEERKATKYIRDWLTGLGWDLNVSEAIS